MTGSVQLDIQLRPQTGKGSSRALRREGRTPAVLYGGEETPVHFSLSSLELNKEIHRTGFLSKIFEVSLGDKKEKMLAREVHFHPVTDLPLHVDFVRVSKGSKITVAVPLHFINEEKSPGIKRGGVLNVLVHNLEVISDIDHIPSHIEIDLTGLDIHDTIHLKNIALPEKVAAAYPERDDTLANIVAPTVMKKTASTEEEGAEEAAASEEAGGTKEE